MILHCGLVLILLQCVQGTEYSYDYGNENLITEVGVKYSFWPSIHNAFRLRREVMPSTGLSEGGVVASQSSPIPEPSEPKKQDPPHSEPEEPKLAPESPKSQAKVDIPVASDTTRNNSIHEDLNSNKNDIQPTKNNTIVAKQLDIHDPAVLMRGVIVFGGFLLMAVVYYIFYKKKSSKNDNSSTHNTNDANQFRYGVLHSEDRRDNLELSRVPLTMESDDEDDEDLEIFDIEQKKKSMSYVNLQTHDEDIVFQKTTDGNDKDNLLLDIEDASVDPLINWNSNGNKSIL